MLQIIREYWGKPIIITSAKRCITHNEKVGGVNGSQHTLGTAADITTSGNINTFYEFIINLYKKDIIKDLGYIQLYKDKNFVHVDVRFPKSKTVMSFK